MTVTTIIITIATTTPIIQYGGDGSVGPPSAVLNKENRFGMLKCGRMITKIIRKRNEFKMR